MIPPGIGMGPDQLGHPLADLAERAAGHDDHLREEQPAQDPVPLWDVAPETEPARLLRGEQGVQLAHPGPEVLEPDRQLLHRAGVTLAQDVEPAGHGQRAHHRALELAVLAEVPEQQGGDLQLVDEVALLVEDPDPVRVAVVGDAQVEAPAPQDLRRLVDVGRDRLRMQPAETGITLGVELGDLGRATSHQVRDVASAGAVHGVMQDVQSSLLDRVQLDQPGDLGPVRGPRIHQLDQALGDCLLDGHGADGIVGQYQRQLLLQPGGDLRGGGAAVVGLVLDPVELGWVVTGGHDHPAQRLSVDHQPGGDLGWAGAVTE